MSTWKLHFPNPKPTHTPNPIPKHWNGQRVDDTTEELPVLYLYTIHDGEIVINCSNSYTSDMFAEHQNITLQ